MLENPRNKEFDVYVLDEVFPENEHSEFLKLIRELNGDWKKRIDDLDVFWFDWKEEHKGRKYLMRLLDIAKDYWAVDWIFDLDLLLNGKFRTLKQNQKTKILILHLKLQHYSRKVLENLE